MQKTCRKIKQIVRMHGKSKYDKSETTCREMISRALPMLKFTNIKVVTSVWLGRGRRGAAGRMLFQFLLATISETANMWYGCSRVLWSKKQHVAG